MAYDRMDWHYGGDFPKDLPPEAGGTHIGMYMAWAFLRGMAGEVLLADEADALARLRQREITGRDVLVDCCDEKFWAEDLSALGQDFAQAYYAGNSAFAAQHSDYLNDYCAVFDAHAASQGLEYPSSYHVENTWANFDLLAPRLDERFAQWQAWRADPAHAQLDPKSQFALACAQVATALAPHGFKPNKRGDVLKLRLPGNDTVVELKLTLDRYASEVSIKLRPFVSVTSKRVKALLAEVQGGEPVGQFIGSYLFRAVPGKPHEDVDWDITPPHREAAVADLVAHFEAQLVALLRDREAGLAQLAADGRWLIPPGDVNRGWLSTSEVHDSSLPYVLAWGTPEQAQQFYANWVAWQHTPARRLILVMHEQLSQGSRSLPADAHRATVELAHARGLRPPADLAQRLVRGRLKPAD